MKQKYNTPQIEVIEIQIEGAVLASSNDPDSSSGIYGVDDFGTGSIFGD